MATFDLVLRGGTVFDGTGAPGVIADVAVSGEKIAAVGTVAEWGSAEMDARGMAVSPAMPLRDPRSGRNRSIAAASSR
jgi:N-acyl-D-aspartate/D-glutamate deacylase